MENHNHVIKLLLMSCMTIGWDITLLATTITAVPGSPFTTVNNVDTGLNYSPNGQWLACADLQVGSKFSLYSVDTSGTLTPYSAVSTHDNHTVSLCFSPDGNFLAVSNNSSVSLFSFNQTTGSVTQLNPTTGNPANTNLALPGTAPSTIVYSPNGKFLAVTLDVYGSASAIQMYTVNSSTGALTYAGTFPTSHDLDTHVSSNIAFSADSRFLAQANLDNTDTITIYAVDQASGHLSPQSGGHYGTDYPVSGGTGNFSSVAYSANGSLLAVSEGQNVFTFTVNQNTGVPTEASMISTPLFGDYSAVTFSPDSQFIALANQGSGSIFVFEVNNQGQMSQIAQLSTPTPYGSSAVNVVFSPFNVNRTSFLSASGLRSITSYALQSPFYSPTNAIGVIRNNVFLLQTARILQITWMASATTDVVSYNIYNGTTVVGNVLATSPLEYNVQLVNGDNGQNFSITAVDTNGVESASTPVVVS